MQGPVEITFKDIKKTSELEDLINQKIAKLERICNYMISCRVIVERPQTYPDRGNPHRVRIDIKVPPAHEIVAKQSASEGDMHDPLQTVIIKTFNAAERQLKELTDRQHRETKTHPNQQVTGIVDKLFPDRGYGFIKTIDTNRDVYFHRNSVLHDDFDRLQIGTGVRFTSETGEKGLQASSVAIVFKARPSTANENRQ
jgi:cold shock CspA family protein/ribosome-associated translation inhibitor RaiA